MLHKYPPVVVVDENDNVTGFASLEKVWRDGLYHRVASVFVQDNHGCFLLQLRSGNVKIYPGCWDHAAGGHVDQDQTYEQAAITELAEETGLHDQQLTVLGTHRTNTTEHGRTINQFERAYLARVHHDIKLTPKPDEVSKLQWFTTAELKAAIAQEPESFTPGLLFGLREYFKI